MPSVKAYLCLAGAFCEWHVGILDRQRIHAVAFVGWSETLPFKCVPKVTTTGATHDLNSHHTNAPVRLRHNGALDDSVKGWPAAATVKFRSCRVEWLITTST